MHAAGRGNSGVHPTYHEETGADLWDSETIWVRLTRVGAKSWTGLITISGIRAKGFRKGNVIRFEPDHVFDVNEVDRRGMPVANRSKAAFIRGKDVLIGLTYLNSDRSVNHRAQLHGTIEVANSSQGIEIRVPGRAEMFTLPPDLRPIQPARPGTYRLKSVRKEVEDPTFICTWTITATPRSRESTGRAQRG